MSEKEAALSRFLRQGRHPGRLPLRTLMSGGPPPCRGRRGLCFAVSVQKLEDVPAPEVCASSSAVRILLSLEAVPRGGRPRAQWLPACPAQAVLRVGSPAPPLPGGAGRS